MSFHNGSQTFRYKKTEGNTMDKLIIAVNELTRLLTKNRRLRRSELTKVLNKTLDGLDEVLENKALLKEAEVIGKKGDTSEAKELITNLRTFQDKFLGLESRALSEASVNLHSRKRIIKKIRTMRKDIVSLVSSKKSIVESLEETRNIVIELLDSLDAPDDDFQIKHNVQKKLHKVLGLSGGVMIISVNVGMFAAEPITSSVSVSFGSALIGKHL